MKHTLLLILGIFCAVQSAPVQVFDCSRGCPLHIAVVCGADGHTYQSECLAVCQGVGVVYGGPCEEFRGAHGSPQQRQTQLHKLLQSAKSHVVRGRSTLEGLSDNNQVLHTLKDMRRFSKEGFRLVGWVPLQDEVFSTHQTVKTDSFTGRTDPGSDVRALRVTNTGLLYATHYDMAALARTLRKANPTASQRTLNTRRQLHECGGLPDLPHFNPDEAHLPRKHLQMRKPGCSRRLLQGTPKQVEDNADKDELSALEDSEVEISDQEVADITSKSSSAPANMTLPACKNMTAVLAGINATSETNCSSNSTDLTFTPAAGIEDDLTELLDGRGVCTPMKFPYKAIGQLELRDSKRMSVCTGAMVGDDAVLTAGHCVFKRDGDGGAFYKSLSFAPGRYRTGTGYKDPYGVIPWAWATVFDTYQAVPDLYQYDWDVAIIRLTKSIGNSVTGYLGLAQGCAINPKTKRPTSSYSVQTAGYATDDARGTCTTMTCSLMRDDCKSRTAYHNCTSKNGLSGSPFFLPKTYRIRGILVGTVSIEESELRVAHVVGTSTYAAVMKWITEPGDVAISDDAKSGDTTVRGQTTVQTGNKAGTGILDAGASFIDGAIQGTMDVLFGGGTGSRDAKKPSAKPAPKPAPKPSPKPSPKSPAKTPPKSSGGLLGSVLGSATDAAQAFVGGKTPARSPPPKQLVKRIPPSPKKTG